MGIGLRIFLVSDDDSIKRLPYARYERLLQRDPEVRYPHYAGKRVRYVEVAIEFEYRKPVKILRISYFVLLFDSEGMIDIVEMEKESRLATEAYPLFTNSELPDGISEFPNGIIDARYLFARKRLNYEYRWKPTREIDAAVVKAIFGENFE